MWKLQGYALCIISICCLNLREVGGGFRVSAATSPPPGEVIARCEDRTSGLVPRDGQESACISPWSEEFQEQYQLKEDTEPGISFRWAPYELSESELRLRYPPGARRPLWGY
jgi:hypothetical protein